MLGKEIIPLVKAEENKSCVKYT